MTKIGDEVKRLYSTFFAYRNDIDIYTEDEDKDKEFYQVLFDRLIDKSIVINEITPLGSSKNVINMCKEDIPNGRKKIYIVDGDIRLIHGNIPNYKNLFVLDAYCIENFLIDEESITNYIYMSCARKPITTIKNELDFNNWLNTYCILFMDLFFHFAIIDLISCNFSLMSAYKFFNKGVFDIKSIEDEISKLKTEVIRNIGQDGYKEVLNDFKFKWNYSVENFLTIVSGKDYLIPIALIRSLEFKSNKSLPSLEEIKLHLVHTCNLDKLDNLKNAIEDLARS